MWFVAFIFFFESRLTCACHKAKVAIYILSKIVSVEKFELWSKISIVLKPANLRNDTFFPFSKFHIIQGTINFLTCAL